MPRLRPLRPVYTLTASRPRADRAGFAANSTEHTLHPYRVIEQCALPIIDPEWSADEELLLVEASETAGLGNWADVAEQVASRSKEELEKHYLGRFIDSPQYPLPVHPLSPLGPNLTHLNPRPLCLLSSV
jgi:hypothetical protein